MLSGVSRTSFLFLILHIGTTYVSAQAGCTRTDWALFCGNGEDPCGMALSLMDDCTGDLAASDALLPPLDAAGGRYTRPAGGGVCVCSLAAYNAFAACAACQSSDDASNWLTSGEWSAGCAEFPTISGTTSFVPRLGVTGSGWLDKSYGDTFNVQQALEQGPLAGNLPLVYGINWTSLIAEMLGGASVSVLQATPPTVTTTLQRPAPDLDTDEPSITGGRVRTSSENSATSSNASSDSDTDASDTITTELSSTIPSIPFRPTAQDESDSTTQPKGVPISVQILAGSLTGLVFCSLGFCAFMYMRRKRRNQETSKKDLSPFALESNNNTSVASSTTGLTEKPGLPPSTQHTNDTAFVPYRYEKVAVESSVPVPETPNESSNIIDTPITPQTTSSTSEWLESPTLPPYHRENQDIQDPFASGEPAIIRNQSRRIDTVVEEGSDLDSPVLPNSANDRQNSGQGVRALPVPPQTEESPLTWSDGPATNEARAV